jgi:hypothetical protein
MNEEDIQLLKDIYNIAMGLRHDTNFSCKYDREFARIVEKSDLLIDRYKNECPNCIGCRDY